MAHCIPGLCCVTQLTKRVELLQAELEKVSLLLLGVEQLLDGTLTQDGGCRNKASQRAARRVPTTKKSLCCKRKPCVWWQRMLDCTSN